jgi:ectoine hydroxylase-related dioxygenase (phytanoyl-CoA dioxygenase family)
MTDQQRDELNGQGFTVLESLLTPSELERLSAAMDEVAEQTRNERGLGPNESVSRRNGLVCHEAIVDLLDHPRILPLVVDAIGWNIQNRDSIFDYKAPQPGETDPDLLSLGWHFDYEEEFAGTTLDGRMPLLDFKVGWYVSDHTEPGHSTILMVPGSFNWTGEQRATWEDWLDPEDIFELRVPAGSAMLWRPTMLHSVTPNLSKSFRKALYISYGPRWIRPSGYMEQDPALIARSSPIRRQLLGAMGDGSDPLGKDPMGSPSSQYWFTDTWDNVPLKAWAEQRAGSDSNDWGLGFGATYTKGPDFNFTQVKIPKK